MRCTLNIFYTLDDAFVPQVGASICSVCENNREADKITFFLGIRSVSLPHQAQLQELASSYGRSAVMIPIEDIKGHLGFSADTFGWNEIVLARLLIDQLLPQDVGRVLYLDGDTIVLGDLRELWQTDLKGKTLAMAPEPTVNRKRKDGLGLKDRPYFNAGVMLVDLCRWREQDASGRILGFYREREGKLFANDQDAINAAMADAIHPLSPRYNLYNMLYVFPYKTLRRIAGDNGYVPESVAREAAAHPVIVHFLGEERPWRRGNHHRYEQEYQRYLSLTPWKEMPQERGWETYFACYHFFWKALGCFPMAQYRIIDGLIPLMIRLRKLKRQKKDE